MNGGRIRLLAAIVTATATAVVVGAVSVPTASAFVNAPYADPAFETQLVSLLDGPGPSVGMDAGAASTVVEAAAAAGRLPALTTVLGAVALGPLAFDLGWKIGRTIDTRWLHLSDAGCAVFGCPMVGAGTYPYRTVTALDLWTPGVLGSPTNPSGYAVAYCVGGSTGSRNVNYGGTNYNGCLFLDSGSPWQADDDAAAASALAAGFVKVRVDAGGGGTGICYGSQVPCYQYVKTYAQIVPLVSQLPQVWTTQRADASMTMTPAPSGSATIAQLTAARGVIAADPHAEGWVNCLLNPSGYVCPSRGGTDPGTTASSPGAVVTGPLDLPEPLPDEQYADYAERLRQLGWDRAIVPVPDPSFGDGTYPAGSSVRQLAPGVVTGVAVAAGATSAYAPSGVRTAWPVSPPQGLATDTEIDVRVVPDGTGAVPPPVTPGTSIHFPTISSPCDKFPFGVLCWAGSIIGAFNAAPVAPGIDWHIPTVTTSVGSPITGRPEYNVSLSYFDSYMTTIRSLISWVLWIGAVWYVGSRLIGLKTGGDPTDAIDGAYDSLID